MLENPFIVSLLIILSMMTVVYIIGLVKNDYSVIDIFWPIGFLLIAHFLIETDEQFNPFIIKIFVTFWAVRLSSYLFFRIVKHGPDMRYRALQIEWGKHHRVHAFFKVFMLQGAFMYLIALPIITAKYTVDSPGIWLWIGIVLSLIGFVMECAADLQLYHFKQKVENKGKYLMTGLFTYSRHPNYLGELLFWYGIALIAIPNPYGYLTLLGPMTLTFALYRFSGVPYAELNQKKTAEFAEYAQRTGAIFPRLW